MMKPTIFISRELSKDSVLWQLSDTVDIIHYSLVKIERVKFDALPDSEWIFFYSSNGVRYFAKHEEAKKNIDQYKVGVLGKGTGATFSDVFEKDPDFEGNGLAEQSVQFLTNIEGKVTFIKAKHSLDSVEKMMDYDKSESLIVYSNELDASISMPDADIYIITSPLNAQGMMNTLCCRRNFKVIAIGETTRQALLEKGFYLASMPKEPSEASILELLKSMI